jgi:hypothetical protein
LLWPFLLASEGLRLFLSLVFPDSQQEERQARSIQPAMDTKNSPLTPVETPTTGRDSLPEEDPNKADRYAPGVVENVAHVVDHKAERALCRRFDLRLMPVLAVMCKCRTAVSRRTSPLIEKE